MKRASLIVVVLFCAVTVTMAKPKEVEVWVGETASLNTSRTKVIPESIVAQSDNPKVATAEWGGGDAGPVRITGVSKGTAVVKVHGKAEMVSVGIKQKADSDPLVSQPVSGDILVTVIEPTKDKRVIMLDKGQRMSLSLPPGAKLREIIEGNRAIASVRKATLGRVDVRAHTPGFTTAKVKYHIAGKNKNPDQHVEGTLDIHVNDTKMNRTVLKENWTGLGTALGIVILDDETEKSPAPKTRGSTSTSGISYDSPTETIGFAPCRDRSFSTFGNVGYVGLVGDDIIDTGISYDIGLRLPLTSLLGESTAIPWANQAYLTASLGYRSFDSSDNFIDDITGFSFGAGFGADLWLGQGTIGPGCFFGALRKSFPFCWGWGAETTLSYTLLDAEGYNFDESASSLALNFKTGPRIQFIDSGWGAEFNVGGGFLMTDYDFNVSNADTGRFSYGLDLSLIYSY